MLQHLQRVKMVFRGQRQQLSLFILILLTVMLGPSVSAQQEVEEKKENVAEVWFQPKQLDLLPEGQTAQVTWLTNATGSIETVWAVMEKWREAEVSGFSEPLVGAPGIDTNATDLDVTIITYYGFVNITAKFVGYNTLLLTLYDELNQTAAKGEMDMTVNLKKANLTTIFAYVSATVTAFTYFLMGMTINLDVVKGIARRPVGPCVGMFCQYVMMPLLSFGLGLLLFPEDNFDDRLLRLGMFLGGCCPGGGVSNMWTHLLGGSLDLSIMMTGVSTFVAFGSVPLWVFTLGPVIINDASFVIPYVDITITVITLIVPCALGIALQKRFPGGKLVMISAKIMSPVCALNLTITFTFGIYAYLYVFTLFTWRMLVAGVVLPTMGYGAGVLLSLLFRMDAPRIIAIAVETGVQNYNIAVIILTLTMASPAGDIAIALPGAFILFTPLPLLMVFFGQKVYQRIRDRSPTATKSSSTDLKDVRPKNSVSNGAGQQLKDEEKRNVGIDNLGADLRDRV